MAYDYSWSVPGPIGPNSWATLVADSAVKQVGQEYADRVWIGAPHVRPQLASLGSGWTVDDECRPGGSPRLLPPAPPSRHVRA